MRIVTAAEMREIDRVTTERYGVPSLMLMENAGTAVAEFVLARYPAVKRIGVVCGKGNNGGDGFVAARKLHAAGREVQVVLLGDAAELRGDAAGMFAEMPLKAVSVGSSNELDDAPAKQVFAAELLLDAILGTGFRPPVSGVYGAAIARINESSAPVVAVDIPSGADADAMGEQAGPMVRADAIVTFTAPRPAHVFGKLTNGPVVVAVIGSPEDAVVSSLELNVITAKDVAGLIGPRPADANKGTFGHVLVIGGSLGKAGAAAMAGMAALRVGAGLATVATASAVLPTVAGFHPELMTEPLQQTDAGSISMRALEYGRLDALARDKSVLAIGPGVSRQAETEEFVRTVVGKYRVPMVLDADGLNAFENRTAELKGKGRQMIITPHPGEMARLAGCDTAAVQADRLNVARKFAREHEVIVVLKGHRTLVVEPGGSAWVNTTGNPGMATGGTGDILTGMIAGLVAQSAQRMVAAVSAAVHLHGIAGDVASETRGEHSMVATDLLDALPEAFRRVRKSAAEKIVEIER